MDKKIELMSRALALGIPCRILTARPNKKGTAKATLKLISLNGIRQSLGSAERFISSREYHLGHG